MPLLALLVVLKPTGIFFVNFEARLVERCPSIVRLGIAVVQQLPLGAFLFLLQHF